MRLFTALFTWGLIVGSSFVHASPLISTGNLAQFNNSFHFNSEYQGVCGNCGYLIGGFAALSSR